MKFSIFLSNGYRKEINAVELYNPAECGSTSTAVAFLEKYVRFEHERYDEKILALEIEVMYCEHSRDEYELYKATIKTEYGESEEYYCRWRMDDVYDDED